jgi:hypothetical protein
MNDELPTLSNLKKRKPEIYRDATCPICGSDEEDTAHLFECPAFRNTRKNIWEEVKKKVTKKLSEITKGKKGENSDRGDQPKKIIQLIGQWERKLGNTSQDLINTCLGLFSDTDRKTWNSKAKEDNIKGARSQALLNWFSYSLLKLYQKKSWMPRCERIIAWERTRNINSRSKKKRKQQIGERKKSRRTTAEVKEKTRGTRRSRKQKDGKIKKPNRKKSERSQEIGSKIEEVVWGWIREGKKWLGY